MGKRKYKGRGSEKCSGNISTLSSKEKKLKKKKSEQTYMFVCVCIYIYIYIVSRMVSWKAKEERVQRRRTDCGILLEVR